MRRNRAHLRSHARAREPSLPVSLTNCHQVAMRCLARYLADLLSHISLKHLAKTATDPQTAYLRIGRLVALLRSLR